MNKKIIRTISIILILLAMTAGLGCVSGDNTDVAEETPTEETTSEDSTENAGMIPVHSVTNTYGEDDDKSTTYGINGDIIIVELEENPTTGYSWNLTHSKGLELSEDNFIQENNTEELAGAGGTRQWKFKLIDTGEQNISATYMRSWEEKAGEEDTFDLTIICLAEDELVKTTATVSYIDLEGGFFGIIAEDDTSYNPINLDEEFLNNGMKVEFVAYPRDDLMSIQMWGQLIEIRTIEKISE